MKTFKINLFTFKILIMSLILFVTNGVAGDLKYAFIDMEAIFQGYYKTVTADNTIKQQTELYKEYALNLEKEREAIQGEFNALRDISQNIALSEEIRDEKRNEAQTKFLLLQEKEKEMQEYQKGKRLDLRKQYEEQRNKIVKEIVEKVAVVAEEQNYDLIIDHSGNTLNGIPVFIYYKKELDITDSILELVNKGHEYELPSRRKTSNDENEIE